MEDRQRFVIPLGEGRKIVFEQTFPPFEKEVCVGIENDNGVWQDLAVIRPKYGYNEDGQVCWEENKIDVLVYADVNKEDYTHRFEVDVWQ